MSNIVPFSFDSKEIRVATDENGEPWFVAKDVAEALGYTRTSDALEHAKRCGVLPQLNKTNDLAPATKWIPESDVYRMIIGCRTVVATTAKEALFSQLHDAKSILRALQTFEIPDDLPDMFVYAIREKDTGNIKFGISRDPEQRLRQLQTGNSSELELVAYRRAENRFADERAIHADAEAYRLRGEWFEANALEVLQ